MSNNKLNFGSLVSVIEQTHQHFQQQAVKAVNVSLTVRNWLVGYFIVTFMDNKCLQSLFNGKNSICYERDNEVIYMLEQNMNHTSMFGNKLKITLNG